MADIKIRGLTDNTIIALDNIVNNNDIYSSRNDLLVDIINLYVSSREHFFLKALPPVVQSLCTESINKNQEMLDKSLEATYNVNVAVLQKLDKIYSLFAVDISQNTTK